MQLKGKSKEKEVLIMEYKREESAINLEIEGRIDSNTSIEFQNQILEAIELNTHIVIDFEKVTYISSAGLRSVLIGQKAASKKLTTVEYTKVSDMVMEVFQTVGFDKILTIV